MCIPGPEPPTAASLAPLSCPQLSNASAAIPSPTMLQSIHRFWWWRLALPNHTILLMSVEDSLGGNADSHTTDNEVHGWELGHKVSIRCHPDELLHIITSTQLTPWCGGNWQKIFNVEWVWRKLLKDIQCRGFLCLKFNVTSQRKAVAPCIYWVTLHVQRQRRSLLFFVNYNSWEYHEYYRRRHYWFTPYN